MDNSKPYCLMPWVHFHVGDDGMAKACCVANIPFGNINTESFESIWNGKPITQLRAKFLKGEPDKRCAHCYKLEAAGGTSIRQETFEKFSDVTVSTTEITKPIYFDIRFSNVCNFKCRTCWHGASSAWFEDSRILGTNKTNHSVIKNIHDFELFIKQLGSSLLGAKEIYFAGGEPLVTNEHYLLLNWLIKNNAIEMKLRYNTNFSILNYRNYDLLKLWNHFENVEIMASIDTAGDTGSYIRSGADWNKTLENRIRVSVIKHIHFKIAPTISVMNVFTIPDLYQECIRQNMIAPLDFYINILERPLQYNIQILPHKIKEQVQVKYEAFMDKFLSSTKLKPIHNQFQEILNYMWNEDLSKHWPKFKVYNDRLDEIREEQPPQYFGE